MQDDLKNPGYLQNTRMIPMSLRNSTQLLISIILPVYNAERHILNCLNSICNQSIPFKYEIMVIDDFSDDLTYDLIKKYSKIDPKIRFKTNSKRQGAYQSRNIGVSLSKGKILAFIDVDCTAAKNWLYELTKPLFEGKGSASIGINYLSKEERIWVAMENMRCRLYYEKGGVDTKNFAILKDMFEEVNGFENSLFSGGDLDLWHKLKNKKTKIVKTNAIVYHHLENNPIKLLLKTRKYAEGDIYYHKRTKGKIPVLALVEYSLSMPIIYLKFLRRSKISLSIGKFILSTFYITLSRTLRNFFVIASSKSRTKNR